jgi:hypothetical protein
LDLQVLGEFDLPWADHQVIIKDKAQTTIFNGNTNATGWIPQQMLVEYIQSSSAWDIKSPHTIEAGDSKAHVYMSTSRQLVIYHTGDMDNDLIPDVKENLTSRLWLEAESHGFGSSHIVSDPFAIDGQALTTWDDTEYIINDDTFYETFQASQAGQQQKYILMFRANSDNAGDRVVVMVKDASQTTLVTGIFPLDVDYYWYSTKWFSLSSDGRIYIDISADPNHHDGEIRVDQLCISPRLDSAGNRVTFSGQVTNPSIADTDGDFMPDGGERRDGAAWFEAELADTIPAGGPEYDPLYSNGQACRMDDSYDSVQIALDDYLPHENGPLERGNYVIKIRAKSIGGNTVVSVVLPMAQSFSQSLTISGDQLTWYSLVGLRIQIIDAAPKSLWINWTSGNCTIDKIGLVAVVDATIPYWINEFACAGGTTPAVFDGRIFTTSTLNPHFRVISGIGSTIYSNASSASRVTSPTACSSGVIYAVEDPSAGSSRIRLVNSTGADIWSNDEIPDSIIGQAVLGDQVILAGQGAVKSYSLADGSIEWTYPVEANHLILTVPRLSI